MDILRLISQFPDCKEPSTKIRIVTSKRIYKILYILNCKEPSTKIRIVTLIHQVLIIMIKIAKNLLLK